MQAKVLYINLPRDWRKGTMVSSEEFNTDLCREADIVIRYEHGRFNIVKDRYSLAGTVPLKELDL